MASLGVYVRNNGSLEGKKLIEKVRRIAKSDTLDRSVSTFDSEFLLSLVYNIYGPRPFKEDEPFILKTIGMNG